MPIADRLAIQELSAKYAFRCGSKAYDSIGEFFASDGRWAETVIGLPSGEGRDAIGAFTAMAQSDQLVTDFAGETHSGTVHLHANGRFDNRDVEVPGYYVDDYPKTEGSCAREPRIS